MEKQIFESSRTRKGKELARLWDAARREMHKRQFPGLPLERMRRFSVLVEEMVPKKGSISLAAVGTGTPEMIGIERLPEAVRDRLRLSDGGPWMREIFRENYPDFKDKIGLVMWDQLAEAYGKGKLGAVFITGGSLGYVISWCEEKIYDWAIDSLRDSLRGVGESLRKDGRFFFDLPKSTASDLRWPGQYEGKEVEYYLTIGTAMDDRHDFTLRTFATGTTGGYVTWHTRYGIHLDLEHMNRLLAENGFSEAKEVPKYLQLDPLYYQLYYAEKKRKGWFIF